MVAFRILVSAPVLFEFGTGVRLKLDNNGQDYLCVEDKCAQMTNHALIQNARVDKFSAGRTKIIQGD